MSEVSDVYRVLVRRALATEKPDNLEIHFEIGVLERYFEREGFSLIRTDTVGRLTKQREWSIDFGIAPEEDAIHASFGALIGLPEGDRDHWAAHALSLPASSKFIHMRLFPSACFDDGEIRPWA
jgi:hypothetical protein